MNSREKEKQIGIPGIAAIMLASSLTVMVGNAITPALPELGEVYGLGNYASWLVTAPALGVVATSVLFGKLIDKKGPYYAAFLGLLFYGTLGTAGAFMPDATVLFIDRFFLGAATAAIMSASVALISVFFDGEKQLRIIAIQGMSMELGGVIFLSISGVLAGISWQYPFYIYALGFVALIMMILFIPKCGRADENVEASADAAMQQGVPVSLVLLIAFFGMLMFFTAMVSLPIYLQKELGYSPVFTGNSVALCIAVVFAGTGFGLSTPLFNSLVVRKSRPEKKGTNISLCTMAMFSGQFLSALLVSVLPGKSLFAAAVIIAWMAGICIIPVTGFYSRHA